MDFDIRDFVDNDFDPEMKLLYDSVNKLVNEAGHLTIADLFLKGREEMGEDTWSAVQNAKPIGFFNIDDDTELIMGAEDLTIADLFLKSRAEISKDAWSAVQSAKQRGLLLLNNKKCCQGNKCIDSDRGWCSETREGKCSISSDSCGNPLNALSYLAIGGAMGTQIGGAIGAQIGIAIGAKTGGIKNSE